MIAKDTRRLALGPGGEARPGGGALRRRRPFEDAPLRDRRRAAAQQRGRRIQPEGALQEGAVVHPALRLQARHPRRRQTGRSTRSRGMYPELEQHRDDVSEGAHASKRSRYASSMERVSKMVSSLAASKKELDTDDLVKLYDSDGITPEQLVDGGREGLRPRGLLPARGLQARQPEDRGEGSEVRHDRTCRTRGCSTTRTSTCSSSMRRC